MFAKEGGGPPWCGIDSLDPERGCDDRVLTKHEDAAVIAQARKETLALAEKFPVYPEIVKGLKS